MKFVCEDQTFSILEAASVTLGVVYPKLKKFVELEDTRLITIAQSLGMEELAPGNVDPESGLEFCRDGIRLPIRADSPAPENAAGMPACEICGKPVQSRRHKTCSQECKREKNRRYAREYQMKIHVSPDLEATEDAGGVDDALPLPEEESISLQGWGSDPGDEPVRASGLG